MLRDGLEITIQPPGDLIKGYALILRDQYQYLKSSVVGQTLKVSFKLFWGLHGSEHSHILEKIEIL